MNRDTAASERWWSELGPRARSYWQRVANSEAPADCWSAYRNAAPAARELGRAAQFCDAMERAALIVEPRG